MNSSASMEGVIEAAFTALSILTSPHRYVYGWTLYYKGDINLII